MDQEALLLEARREVIKALATNGVTGMTVDMIGDMAVTAVMKLRPDLPLLDDPLFARAADQNTPPPILTEAFNPDAYIILRSDTLTFDSPLGLFEARGFNQIDRAVCCMARIGKVIRHTLRGHLYLAMAANEDVRRPVYSFVVIGITKKGTP